MYRLKVKTNDDMLIHFIGIGGIGMSGIAEVLLSQGVKVSGSDCSDSMIVTKLRELGAMVTIGHHENNVKNASVVVYSSAIKDDNSEMKYARGAHIPIMQRAEMLAELMRLKHGVAIAGTHGKTTTSSFLATILEECNIDPTYVIGGIVQNLKKSAKAGQGDLLVAEADESDGSFLQLNPIMSVITNIDFDHMDYYGTPDKLLDAFLIFANKVPFYGLVSLNVSDHNVLKLIENIKRPYITFAVDQNADYMAKNIGSSSFGQFYDLYFKNSKVGVVDLNLIGEHNIENSLAAISLAHNLGLNFKEIIDAVKKFKGVGRRFQFLKKGDFEVIDDYAHHPTAIKKTLGALRKVRKDSNIIVFFEPHRYTRTRDSWADFIHSFNSVDRVYLTPIYPASELPIDGISSDNLMKDINRVHPGLCRILNSVDRIDNTIIDELNENTNGAITFITLGAGSIGKAIAAISFK